MEPYSKALMDSDRRESRAVTEGLGVTAAFNEGWKAGFKAALNTYSIWRNGVLVTVGGRDVSEIITELMKDEKG